MADCKYVEKRKISFWGTGNIGLLFMVLCNTSKLKRTCYPLTHVPVLCQKVYQVLVLVWKQMVWG